MVGRKRNLRANFNPGWLDLTSESESDSEKRDDPKRRRHRLQGRVPNPGDHDREVSVPEIIEYVSNVYLI